jgi:archaellum component FlaC
MGKVTLEKLATMIRDGFADMDKRFQGVDARFESIDSRFEGVDARFDSLERKMGAKIQDVRIDVENLRGEMIGRFDDLGEEIRGMHRATDSVSGRVDKLDKRVAKLELKSAEA